MTGQLSDKEVLGALSCLSQVSRVASSQPKDSQSENDQPNIREDLLYNKKELKII